jgi:phosphoglycolate phosphatase
MTLQNYIFDFDGTLVDTLDDVLDSLKKAFQQCGVEPPAFNPSKILQFQLKDAIQSSMPGITTEKTELIAGRFREIYDAIDYPNTWLMPTVPELLSGLKERSAVIFIVSNKRAVPMARILDKFNIRRFFTGIFNPDMFEDGNIRTKSDLLAYALQKHSLNKKVTGYIGDSEGDIKAARENGVLAIAVQNGYGDTSSFTIRPDHTVRRIIEILSVEFQSQLSALKRAGGQ